MGMRIRVLAVMATGVICTMATGKEGPTYYTPQRVQTGRDNVQRHDWAKAVQKRIMDGDPIVYYIGPEYTSAAKFAAQSDEFMWMLQPTTKIPRVYPHETVALCPVHGKEVRRYSVWCPWNIDPINHPYKIQCMMGGEWYPSNDYHKGDLKSGQFADDGTGFDHQGKRYYPLSEYAHMVYGSVVIPTLRSLTQAYLLTGEKNYAHKAGVLLARLATEYPNYGWDDPGLENRFDRTYLGPYKNRHPHYEWKHGGMITDLIWETFCLEATAYAYDALYDPIGQDAELLAFVQAKGMPVKSAAELRKYIETYILRAGMVGLAKGEIHGNEGFHQAAALACALVMDDYSNAKPNSKDMADYAFHGIGNSAYMMVNGLARDGGGHESPGYNVIKCDFIRVNRLMEEVRKRRPELFPAEKYPDLFANPKAKGLFDYYVDLTACDLFLPSIGDGGGIQKPSRHTESNRFYSYLKKENAYAFQRYGDPRHARACTTFDGKFFAGELWEPYPADTMAEALRRPESRIVRRSRLLDGYGIAFLESGESPKSRAAVVNYSALIGHRQQDMLVLELFARGVDLLPDLGYPRTWDYRWQWDANSLAHNTVTVDETQPPYLFFGNGCRLMASEAGVHVATTYHNPYGGVPLGAKDARPVDLYERTVVMIDVDDDRFYVVDLFAVAGGEQHDQSWHAMLTPVEAPALDWKTQAAGTLAGQDVPQFGKWTDKWGRQREDFPSYLTGIRRSSLASPAAWKWNSGLPEGDALALHVVPVGGPLEVIMGKGKSPVWPEDQSLDYVLVRRQTQQGGRTLFLSVLDPHQKAPLVKSVRLVSPQPLVLEVSHGYGIDQITLNIPDGPSRTTKPRPVGVRVVMTKTVQRGELTVREVRVGHLADVQTAGYAQATISEVDYAHNRIIVEAASSPLFPTSVEAASPPLSPSSVEAASSPLSSATGALTSSPLSPGRYIRIHNDMRSAMFQITACKPVGDKLELILDKTALLAQFPVTHQDVGQIGIGVTTPFITGQVDKAGNLENPSGNYYHGAWVGEGQTARPVDGISPGRIHLAQPVPKAQLEKEYAGKVVSVWQYAPGDRIEAANVASAR